MSISKEISLEDQIALGIATVQEQVREVVAKNQRRINKYDLQSPLMDDKVIALLMDYTAELLPDLFAASDLEDGSNRQRVRAAIGVLFLQQRLNESPTIASYDSSRHNEVLMTMAGCVVQRAVQYMDSIGRSVPVDEDTVKLLTDVHRREVYANANMRGL